MDRRLPQIIQDLRAERCPPSVRGRVARRIALQRPAGRIWRARMAWSVAVAAVVATWGLSELRLRRDAREMARQALVREQTGAALALAGQAFLQAALRTEDTLSKHAGPPLRNGFENLKSRILNGN